MPLPRSPQVADRYQEVIGYPPPLPAPPLRPLQEVDLLLLPPPQLPLPPLQTSVAEVEEVEPLHHYNYIQ